ncbi:Camk4 [Symbiodinium sp. KB8]|nr:Camk4 [Symbiodinium sp. KB8]
MKYWRKRLFILTSKDLRYYESGEPRARGSIELRDIKRVHAVHARGQFDVDTASGRVYQLMALSDRERAQWMSAINDAQFSPTPLARLLRVVEDLEVAGHIDSDARKTYERKLLACAEDSSGLAELEVGLQRISAGGGGADTGSAALEDLLSEMAAAQTELAVIKALASLHDQLLMEPVTAEVQQRLKDLATAHQGAGDGRWTEASSQAYSMVLSAVTLKPSPGEERSRAAAAEAKLIAASLHQLEQRVHTRGSEAAAESEVSHAAAARQEDSLGPLPSIVTKGRPTPIAKGSSTVLSVFDMQALYAPPQVTLTPEQLAQEAAQRKADRTTDVVADTADLVSPGTYGSVWDTQGELGKGAYSVVYACSRKSDGQPAAAKWVQKSRLHRKALLALLREIRLMRSISHPNIVSIVDFFDEPDHYIIVAELMTGGELFDEVVRRSHYTERAARDVIRTMAEALAYLHERGVAHRDLKPENILLSSSEDDGVIKLADLGFARSVPKSGLSTACGTPSYVAPEILNNTRYGLSVDMWSLGVIAYILLCGYAPFADRHQPTLFRKIRSGLFFFDPPQWNGVSAQAKDLIERMLTVNPAKRITAAEALQHPWLTSFVGSARLSLAKRSMSDFNSQRREVLRTGICTKLGSIIKSWRRRVFTLTRDELAYADPESKSTRGTIPLGDISEARLKGEGSGGGGEEFEVLTHFGRILEVQAADAADARAWVSAISMAKAAHDALARAEAAASGSTHVPVERVPKTPTDFGDP